jgi:hypothetical protein
MRTAARSGCTRKPNPLLSRPAISGMRGAATAGRDSLAAIAANDSALPSAGWWAARQGLGAAAAARLPALPLVEGDASGASAPPLSISSPDILSASSLGLAGALAVSDFGAQAGGGAPPSSPAQCSAANADCGIAVRNVRKAAVANLMPCFRE